MKKLLPLLVFMLPLSAFAFGPCTNDAPTGVSYLPSVSACGGKAAIVTYGKYVSAFSAVVRDCNNNDRDPCNTSSNGCGSNFSSPFKAQQILSGVISASGHKKNARIFCLKEAGDSAVYKLVRRMTIKLADPVTSPDQVLKICLTSRTTAKNDVKVVSVRAKKSVGATGYSAVCKTQKYLACSIAYKDICPQY